jgi:hypothetical protein
MAVSVTDEPCYWTTAVIINWEAMVGGQGGGAPSVQEPKGTP